MSCSKGVSGHVVMTSIVKIPLICLSRIAPREPRDCSWMRQVDKVELDYFVKELGEVLVAREPDPHEPVILAARGKQAAIGGVGHEGSRMRKGLAPYDSIRQAPVAFIRHGVLASRLLRSVTPQEC